jgi:hypothetical protein
VRLDSYRRARATASILTLLACGSAGAGQAEGDATLPSATAVFAATRTYPINSFVTTSHAGWSEARACVNFAQDVRLDWKVDSSGEAILESRPAWDANALWSTRGRWGRGSDEAKEGDMTLTVSEPSLLRLRVRAAKFPKSGIARLKATYERRTVAVLRGEPGARRRPVMVADGYDPFNTQDLNDTSWQTDPTFYRLVSRGYKEFDLDTWIVDWGDGGAPLQQQGEDFQELARQVRAWNGGRDDTVAVGISMGAISIRYALASSAGKEDLGVGRYVSVNGPHRGAWLSPELREFLLKRAARQKTAEAGEAFMIRKGLDNPAARQLLIDGPDNESFYSELRSKGDGGYDPDIPRVAFSNGSLVRDGNDLADLVDGDKEVVHRISVRPLGLPLWITLHRTRREFRYGAFPGELLPASLRDPVREHIRLLGIFRFDFRARWEKVPTFIPTHSALDFPEALSMNAERYRYQQWRQSAFPVLYVSPNRNLPHDVEEVPWVNPRTGKGAPPGTNAILYEVVQSFGGMEVARAH